MLYEEAQIVKVWGWKEGRTKVNYLEVDPYIWTHIYIYIYKL